ncbi:ferrous iron transport protein A [Symmachiella macrocystis]|uniref:Ferrous iron transport protein A n=1 Tax=Symmachiella macrocystis TaxID=2527985 RepID=A0A5C6BSZ7_9PLAN|nr:ferrous iron transport protein A [Symmachiella macrocystis]TWU14837.1 ferrous iron transport protein A [Symmachiella macrocystis]
MTTLDGLKLGERARIVEISGDDGIAIRLMEMGLIDGEEIELLGFAPLGDPIEFELRGYRLSLRKNEARRVSIEPLPQA